jgi:hypothetical protein
MPMSERKKNFQNPPDVVKCDGCARIGPSACPAEIQVGATGARSALVRLAAGARSWAEVGYGIAMRAATRRGCGAPGSRRKLLAKRHLAKPICARP